MINRILIRAKVLQMLYSYTVSSDSVTVRKAQNELKKSLDKSYELYNALLQLIVELTEVQDLRLDEAKHKFLPTEEDINPNLRFVENKMVEALRKNETLRKYVSDNHITWRDDELFMRLMLDKVRFSDDYKAYMRADEVATAKERMHEDTELWVQLLKKVILPDADFAEYLENKCVYWTDDDLTIMGQFVVKTIRGIERGQERPIFPMYKDDDDSLLAEKLFLLTLKEMDENNALIDQFVVAEKWDAERIALMDRIVMCVALTEIRNFLEIPVLVSLNEYIELAKEYSTPQSGKFVNGILNAVVKHLRAEGKIVKP